MAGAGTVILFVAFFVGLVIWSLIYLTFVSHYFLTTLIDSSAGHDEVQYPRESLFDWWWKPIFCLWVLSAWLIPVTVVLAPMSAWSPVGFAITWFVVLWCIIPLSFLSTLHAQNWFFFMHPVVVWRALRHWNAYFYVNLITLLSGAMCAAVLIGAFMHNILWAGLAVFLIPTSLLFFARNWGRFAWLSLNFVPRGKKRRRDGARPSTEEIVPEVAVEEIDPADEGIREGLPPDHTGGIREGVPLAAGGVAAGLPPAPFQVEEDAEWAKEKKPYLVIEDGVEPEFEEKTNAPAVPSVGQTSSGHPVEEEDEWATEKKPYTLIGDSDFGTGPPQELDEAKAEIDKPLVVSKHYADRHAREKEVARQAKEKAGVLPPPSKKTPTFVNALFFGVFRFMIYERTLTVWGNMVVLTFVELFFAYMVKMFFPQFPE